MRPIILALVIGLCACASTSGAGDRPPPFTTAAIQAPAHTQPDFRIDVDLPAGAYQLDPRHANVSFRIRHMNLAWFTARFDGRAATLTLNPLNPERSQLTASVEAASVNTGVLTADGERAFDRSIARALGGDTQPTITFVSTAIERTGEFTGRMTGDLTMNGQTHPATLDVLFDGGANDPLRGGNMVLGFSAYGSIDRTLWGVNAWRAFTGDQVQIVIEAELVRS